MADPRSLPDQPARVPTFWLCEEHAEDGGECQCGLTPYVPRAESDRLREIVATLRAYIAAPEGDGPLRYTEALALADSATPDEFRDRTENR